MCEFYAAKRPDPGSLVLVLKECHREDPALLAGISQAQGPELRSKSPRNESSHEVPWRSENRIMTFPKTEVDRSIGSIWVIT